jgi:hypothetical protein
MKHTLIIAFLFTLVSGITACNKENPDPTVTEPSEPFVADFEYSGKQHVYSPVTFTSNFKEDTKLTWNFGNGEEQTIYGKGITYNYTTAGSYTVTMTIVDSFGGAVSKGITISNGPERISGKHNWNFFLKGGDPVAVVPTQTFSRELELEIVNDTTIRIPDIPQMRIRGPYTVKKFVVDAEKMVYKSDDLRTEVSYVFETFTGGMKIVQVHKDTVWTLTGVASIYN